MQLTYASILLIAAAFASAEAVPRPNAVAEADPLKPFVWRCGVKGMFCKDKRDATAEVLERDAEPEADPKALKPFIWRCGVKGMFCKRDEDGQLWQRSAEPEADPLKPFVWRCGVKGMFCKRDEDGNIWTGFEGVEPEDAE